MEYKSYNTKKYVYWCKECGNEFERNNQLEILPYRCYVCSGVDTICESEEHVEEIHQYCPICENFFKTSEYLNENIDSERVRWIANMVTHYRHYHLRSWDRTWGKNGYGRRFLSSSDYEEEKRKVNERAKRQILRKCKNEMKKDGFFVEDVLGLEFLDPKTFALYEKILGHRKNVS